VKARATLIGASCAAAVLLGVLVAAERRLSSAPDGCAACHAMRRYVASFKAGRDLDSWHRQASVGCYDCHQGYSLAVRARTAALYAVGAVGEPPRRRYDDAMCNRCHVSLEYQAAHTDLLCRNPHRSHWPELACADCHLAHGAQVDFCGQCHDNGGQRMTGDPVVSRAPNRWWSAPP
jgi:cytochrome c nitrite reductase small subunit